MVHLKRSESEAIALAVHSGDAGCLLGSTQAHHIARSASGRTRAETDSKRLIQNDLVKVAVEKCTYELAVTQQRVEIQRAMSLSARRQSTPRRSLSMSEPGERFDETQQAASSVSNFLAAYGIARRAKAASDSEPELAATSDDEISSSSDSGRGETLLTGKKVERLQREISMRAIAAITVLQVKYRKKLARKAAEDEERMRVKREIHRLKRSATESMLTESMLKSR